MSNPSTYKTCLFKMPIHLSEAARTQQPIRVSGRQTSHRATVPHLRSASSSPKLNQLQPILRGLSAAEQDPDLAGVEPVHPGQGAQHQQAVEDEDERLGRHQVPVVALDVLDDAEHAPNPDQRARYVQGGEVAPPPN